MRVDVEHGVLVAVTALLLVAPSTNQGIVTSRKITSQQNSNCAPREQQRNVNLAALAGYWYAVETIGHREEDRVEGEAYREIPVCPLVFFSQLENSSDIRLLWEEPLGWIEYRLQVVDPEDPGFWISMGQQNGSLTENGQYPYRQFAGMVQVMRAVASDMVLTFCSPHTLHYSIIMSRNRNMSEETLHSLNKMLQDRGLASASTSVACKNGAAAHGLGIGVALVALMNLVTASWILLGLL